MTKGEPHSTYIGAAKFRHAAFTDAWELDGTTWKLR